MEVLTFAAYRQVYPPVFSTGLSAITDDQGVAILSVGDPSSWSGAVVVRDVATGDMTFWYYVPIAAAVPAPEVRGTLITDRAVYKPGEGHFVPCLKCCCTSWRCALLSHDVFCGGVRLHVAS